MCNYFSAETSITIPPFFSFCRGICHHPPKSKIKEMYISINLRWLMRYKYFIFTAFFACFCQHLYYYPGPGDGPHVWQPKEQARAEAQCPCERPKVASVMFVYVRACARRRADNVVLHPSNYFVFLLLLPILLLFPNSVLPKLCSPISVCVEGLTFGIRDRIGGVDSVIRVSLVLIEPGLDLVSAIRRGRSRFPNLI
jgi:hypothetical protein